MNMNFGDALAALRAGRKIQRKGWNGPNQHAWLWTPVSRMEPCLVLHNAHGMEQPGWVPSQGDLLADDWRVLDD